MWEGQQYITQSSRSLWSYNPEKIKRLAVARLAVDETYLKSNGVRCWLFAAIDIERNKIIFLGVYPARNALTAYSFLKEVLRLCEVEEIILDRGPWYRYALKRLGIKFRHERFGKRSFVESVFSSFKQRARIFFCSITVNFRRKEKRFGLRWLRVIECWNTTSQEKYTKNIKLKSGYLSLWERKTGLYALNLQIKACFQGRIR